MRAVIALSLSMLVCIPGFGQQAAGSSELVRQQVSKMKPGTKVTIKLHNKEKIKGTLLAADASGMTVKTVDAQKIVNFADIKEVGGPTPKWAWGVIIALAALIVGGLVIGYAQGS